MAHPQHGRFHDLAAFTGRKRFCQASLAVHRGRRGKPAQQAVAGEAARPAPVQLQQLPAADAAAADGLAGCWEAAAAGAAAAAASPRANSTAGPSMLMCKAAPAGLPAISTAASWPAAGSGQPLAPSTPSAGSLPLPPFSPAAAGQLPRAHSIPILSSRVLAVPAAPLCPTQAAEALPQLAASQLAGQQLLAPAASVLPLAPLLPTQLSVSPPPAPPVPAALLAGGARFPLPAQHSFTPPLAPLGQGAAALGDFFSPLPQLSPPPPGALPAPAVPLMAAREAVAAPPEPAPAAERQSIFPDLDEEAVRSLLVWVGSTCLAGLSSLLFGRQSG